MNEIGTEAMQAGIRVQELLFKHAVLSLVELRRSPCAQEQIEQRYKLIGRDTPEHRDLDRAVVQARPSCGCDRARCSELAVV